MIVNNKFVFMEMSQEGVVGIQRCKSLSFFKDLANPSFWEPLQCVIFISMKHLKRNHVDTLQHELQLYSR